jgi:hypothetical protein
LRSAGDKGADRRMLVNCDTAGVWRPTDELSLAAFESDLCFARMFDNFVWASLGIGWMEDAARGRLGQLPFEAISALSQTHFGRLEHAHDLKLKGAVQYGRVLRATADAVGTRDSATRERVVISIILLIMHALYYPYRQWEAFLERSQGAEEEHKWGEILRSDQIALISHIKGITEFVYHCGPEAFQTKRMQKLFECIRMVLVCDPFLCFAFTRKGTFVCEWDRRDILLTVTRQWRRSTAGNDCKSTSIAGAACHGPWILPQNLNSPSSWTYSW